MVREVAAAAAVAWLRRAAAPFFRPDVAVVPDPLAPDPGAVASGIEAALRKCAAEDRPVRLLLARAPGARFRVALHSLKGECAVELAEPAPSPPRRAVRVAAPFSLGLLPAVFDIEGDDVRLVVLPGLRADSRVRVRRWPARVSG